MEKLDPKKRYKRSKKGRERYREQKRRWNQKPAVKAKKRIRAENQRLRAKGDREGRLLVWRDVFGSIRTERLAHWVDGEKYDHEKES